MKKYFVLLITLLFVPYAVANENEDYTEEVLNLITDELVEKYIQTLEDFGPRVTGNQACYSAGEYIYSEFEKYGYEAEFLEWNTENWADRNVEAILPGQKSASVIICGHFDSVPSSPGADDNGSGTAAVLAAANALSEFKDDMSLEYTIRFVAFSGEEEGLLGSYAYADNASSNNMEIVAVLNADMIGYTRSDEGQQNVLIGKQDTSAWITDIAIEAEEDFNLNLNISTFTTTWGSDHIPFLQNNYDAVFFHEYEFNDFYHSENDTLANMDLEYDVRVTKLVIATMMKIANAEFIDNQPPKIDFIKPNNFLYIADREIVPTDETIIIGKITLQLEISDVLSGIDNVQIFIDGIKKATLTEGPYYWVWDEFVLFDHEVTVLASDKSGNEAEEAINVKIFNI